MPPPRTWNFWPGGVSAASARKANSISGIATIVAAARWGRIPRSAGGSCECVLDRPDRERPEIQTRPEVPRLVVGLGRPEPQAAVVGDIPGAPRGPPCLAPQSAAQHEGRERVRRPDPDLGRLLARRVDPAAGRD